MFFIYVVWDTYNIYFTVHTRNYNNKDASVFMSFLWSALEAFAESPASLLFDACLKKLKGDNMLIFNVKYKSCNILLYIF